MTGSTGLRYGPFAPAPLQAFIATTGHSAPVPSIGTLVLVGLPLGRLPLHLGDRFPGSIHEPKLESRHLNAGRRADSKQVASALIPG